MWINHKINNCNSNVDRTKYKCLFTLKNQVRDLKNEEWDKGLLFKKWFKKDKIINKLELVSREEFEVLKKLVQKQDATIKKLIKKKNIKKAKKS